MRIEKIKYTDFNGVEHTEEHCFHLGKLERMRLDASYQGGIEGYVESSIRAGNIGAVLGVLENIIQTAHGIKSADGARFIKSADVNKDFVESGAYEAFVVGMIEDENAPERVREFISNTIGENA